MTIEQVLALVAALGGGAFFREIATGIWKLITGRQAREKDSLQEALKRLDAASKQVDIEATYRRRVEEHASALRRIAIENGLGDKLPPFPTRTR